MYRPLIVPGSDRILEGGSFSLRLPSITLLPGHIYYVCGPSGSGKTSFLNFLVNTSLARTDNPSQVAPSRWEGDIAYISHTTSLASWLNIDQNLNLESALRSKLQDRDLFVRLLENFELNHAEISKLLPRHLSHGMRQRVEIAMAMSFQPDLLVIDEGFSGIHCRLRERILSIVSKASTESGMSVLFTSHSASDGFRFASEAITVIDGLVSTPLMLHPSVDERMRMQPEQVLALPGVRSVFATVA